MTGLLKGGLAARDIRSIRSAGLGVDEEVARLRRRVEILEACVKDREDELEARADDREEAFTQGRAAGLGEARDLSAGLVGALEKGILAARKELGEALAGAERLAACLAYECLAKMFRDTDERARLVNDLIRSQMATLEASAVLSIALSSKDFPDPADYPRLDGNASDGVRVEARDSLASGSCVMTLRLGEIDIGLDQQWGALGGLLVRLAEPDRPS